MASRQEIQNAREAGTNADHGKIPAVAGENAVNLATLGYGSDRPVDETEVESSKFGVELQRPSDVGWKRQFVFVAGRRVKDLGDEFAHRFALRSQEIIHFREDESWHDNGSGRSQDSFVFRKARLADWRPGKGTQETARVGNDTD